MRARLRAALALGAALMAALASAFADSSFALNVERTSDGAVEYFDFAGVGSIVLLVAAVAIVLIFQRRRVKRIASRRPRRAVAHPDTSRSVEERLADLNRATEATRQRFPGMRR